jgi:hypothetical protein
MRHRIILTSNMASQLKEHILEDRSKEQMAITLCGVNQLKDETRLLCRHLILLPADAFEKQSSAYLELSKEAQSYVLRMAYNEGLSQIDWHSHPGDGHIIGFSGIDDHHEARMAKYLHEKIPGTFYASVVMNKNVFDARIWETNGRKIEPRPVDSVRWGEINDERPCSANLKTTDKCDWMDDRFSRQVLAFGVGLQNRLRQLRFGIIGVGGLGGIIVEMLSRLGASTWVLIDDDLVEASNLNRLPGSTQRDVYFQTPKVSLTQRNIARVNPYAKIRALQCSITDPQAIQALKSCDLLIVATDNHSSRLIANRLSVQYLIPLIHAGVNIDIDEERKISDISGEYVIPSVGEWCLHCSGIIDTQLAGWELADKNLGNTLRERGYIKDTPAPAVYHLNGVVSSLAVSEIHNLIFPYKTLRRYLTYDELQGELLSLDVQSKGDCLVCSADNGILGLGDLEDFPDYRTREKALPFADQFEPGEVEEGLDLSSELFLEDNLLADVKAQKEVLHDFEDA